MKIHLLRSLATHLAGLAAGAALAWALVAAPRTKDQPPPPKHRSTTLAARFSPTVKLELERLLEDIEAGKESADAQRGLTPQERNLQRIEAQRLAGLRHEKELARLRSIAGTFAETEDLSPVLTDTLASGDHDLSRALFLEWHRRDPDAAFDALARRGAWLEAIDDVLVRAVPDDELITQVAREDRPESFRYHLARKLGAKIGSSDDLAVLTRTLDGIKDQRWPFFAGFTETWIPRDGKEAARFIGLEMTPDHQGTLLEALAGYGANLNPQPWTEELAASLFNYDLNVSTKIYDQLAANAEASQAPITVRPDTPDPGLEADAEPEDATNALLGLLDRTLHHQRDYPDLFSADAITMDEIVDTMTRELPAAARHPAPLKRALFQKLAPHNPARAITWASANLSRHELNEEINTIIWQTVDQDSWGATAGVWSPGYDPRSQRLADMLAVLQPSTTSDLADSWITGRFIEWSRLAPEEARAAVDRIPASQPFLKSREVFTVTP